MLSFWWRPFLTVVGLGALALALSVKSPPGTGWGLFSMGLLAYLIYHLRQLSKLNSWLGVPGQRPMVGDGVWGDVLYRLEKLLRAGQGDQQKAVAELERMLEATRNLPDGVVILDRESRILWLNDAAERLLGLSPLRDVGQFVPYLLRQSRFIGWLQEEDFSRTLQMESPVKPQKTLELQLVPLPKDQKMLLARDISELARVEAMRRDFVANVSHELRTPITVIVGFLEVFDEMENPDPTEFKKHIPLMREQSDRIRSLVDDLLTLAKLETEPESKEEAVDIAALTHRLADEARTMSQGKHDIQVHIDSNLRLLASPQELYSALANLVSNAVRYTPAGGHIALKWHIGPRGSGLFSVTDTGEGIEAQHIPRLTERFYRVDRGRSRATGGTGLGLAIVKHILQRHQARLRVDSTVGKGSTFTAAFPPDRLIPASTNLAAQTLES
ncbi:MAG: phosphate regulon sensor histidine kinase PhoR [Thiobacillus sp.]|nr:phosphate regulon sensor histidine kinase PhoR [Thiobacillus sp.]